MDLVDNVCPVEYIGGYFQHFWQDVDVPLNISTTDLRELFSILKSKVINEYHTIIHLFK